MESGRVAELDGPAGRSPAIGVGGGSINATAGLLAELPGILQHDNGVRGFSDPVAVRGVTSTPLLSAPVIDLRYGGFPIAAAYTVFSAQPGSVSVARLPAGSLESIRSTQPGGGIEIGRPSTDAGQTGGLLTAEIGQRDARAVRAEGHGTIAGAAAFGFLSWSQDDGRLTNTALDTRPDFRESLHAETRLCWAIGDRSTVTVQLIAEESDDGVQPLVPLSDPGYEVDRPSEGETGLTNVLLGLAFAHTNDSFGFTSRTTTHYWNLDPFLGTVVVQLPLISDLTSRTVFLAQEFQLESIESADAFEWTAGLTLKGHDRTIDAVRVFAAFGPVEWSESDLGSRELLLNGAVRLQPVRGIRTTLGLKADWVRSSLDRISLVPPAPRVEKDRTDVAVLPFLRLDGPGDRGLPWSIALVSGWKPGGYSSFSDQPELVGFKPERTWTLEGTVAANREGALELTAYATLSNDTQVERSFTETDYLVRNAERTRIFGAELAGRHALGDDLTLSGRASWTRAVFDAYVDPFTGADFSGQRVPYVPEYGLDLALDYRPALGFAAGIQIRMSGPVHYEESNDPFYTQEAWISANAWLGWRWPRADLTVTGTNLFSDEHWTSMVLGLDHGVPVLPRRIGARFRWFF